MGEMAEDSKVVAHLSDGRVLKGFLRDQSRKDIELVDRFHGPLPNRVQLHDPKTDKAVSLDLDATKALFFVKSFEGRTDYREVKFFETNPPNEGLWVRVKFRDNETTEGVVRNSVEWIIHPGFFLKPPDPLSNNKMVYVVKKSLMDFRILAVRSTY